MLAILNIRSSYIADTERAIKKGEVPDTVQWWLGEQAWRIKTFAVDHDIHMYSFGPNRPDLLELAQQNNQKHYGDVIAEQYVLKFSDCTSSGDVAAVLTKVCLRSTLECAAPNFAFWKPDDANYRPQSNQK